MFAYRGTESPARQRRATTSAVRSSWPHRIAREAVSAYTSRETNDEALDTRHSAADTNRAGPGTKHSAADPNHRTTGTHHTTLDANHAAALTAVSRAVDALVGHRHDELSDEQIRSELTTIEEARRRLDSRASRLVDVQARRAAERAERERPGDAQAGERARRRAHRELDGLLNWAPGEAARAGRDGDRLGALPLVGDAADRGEISSRHARLIADVLERAPAGDREALEADLVEAARRQDPRTFGRTCRRRLADLDHDAAMKEQALLHADRGATVAHTAEGMVMARGRWAGEDGETVLAAIHAFRRPDRAGEIRTSEQRTADAIADAMRAALSGEAAPTRHGVRPHVTVTVPLATLLAGRGVAETEWSGPVPWGELRHLLHDAGLSWLATTVDGRPVAVTSETRTVPPGLWRMLVARDGGCIADGCATEPRFCDVMHIGDPHARGGGLSLESAGLGCRYHHRRLDRGVLRVEWRDGRPTIYPARGSPG